MVELVNNRLSDYLSSCNIALMLRVQFVIINRINEIGLKLIVDIRAIVIK